MARRNKSDRAQRREEKRNPQNVEVSQDYIPKKESTPVKPRGKKQAALVLAMESSIITYAVGVAGTGKTYLTAAKAVEALIAGDVYRIIITRPMIGVEEDLGHLPGGLEEKFSPYAAAILDVLIQKLGRSQAQEMIKAGKVELIPLGMMRGRSFPNCWIFGDEMQNATKGQMKMFLTRIGENSKVTITGDPSQTDIGNKSGLMDSVNRMEKVGDVSVVTFEKADIVRSGIVQKVVEAYEE